MQKTIMRIASGTGLILQGMSRALFATAFAMVLVPAIALIIRTPAFANGVVAVFGFHAVFAMLFVGSALLFRRASANRL